MQLPTEFLYSIQGAKRLTKHENIMFLFDFIRRYSENAEISRSTLCELTGLSPSTITILTNRLLDLNLIKEAGACIVTDRGRKPTALKVNSEGGYFVVINLLSNAFVCSLYDLCVRCIESVKYHADDLGRPDFCSAVAGILERNGVAASGLKGINITYPGILDIANKQIGLSTVLSVSRYAKNEDILLLKSDWPNAELLLTNTAVVGAYAEYILNYGLLGKSIIGIMFNEGIGAGVVVVDDHGDCLHYYMMEIGHMVIERGGEPCKCGSRGCLEALCGLAAVIKRINEKAGLGLVFDEEFGSEINEQAVNRIRTEMNNGNAAVISIVDEVADMLEIAIINIINMVNAEFVFLAGNMIEILSDERIERINRNINENNLKRQYLTYQIRRSGVDDETSRQGAVHMLIDKTL